MNLDASRLAFAKLTSIRMYFYQWALKWHYGNAKENISQKPDLPIIICILQAMGFKLREFERKDQLDKGKEAVKRENIKITMECGTSEITAVLDMDEVKCTCQDNAEVQQGSVWSVSGTEPANSNHLQRIEETGSNLLPEVPKEAMQAIQEIIYRIIKVINAKGEVSTNEFKEIVTGNAKLSPPTMNVSSSTSSKTKDGLIRSYTDIYKQPSMEVRVVEPNLSKFKSTKSMKISTENNKQIKHQLQRQGTFELQNKDEDSTEEPRSPLQLISNLPVQALCSSLGQLSLQSDEEVTSLADYVLMAHEILDNAVKVIKKKIPGNSSFNQDENGNAKPTIQQMMNSSFLVNSSFSQSSSHINTSSIPGSTSSLNSRSSPSSQLKSSKPQNQRVQQQQQQQRSIPKPTILQPSSNSNQLGSTGASRDRSSSFSSGQRAVFSKIVNSSGQNKRNSSLNNLSLEQRTIRTGLKQPTSRKLVQPKSVCSLTSTEQSSVQVKRRTLRSPNTSISTLSNKPKEQQRANVSLIKPPSSSRVVNSNLSSTASKFGFLASKK